MEELVKRAKVGDNQAFTELIMNIQMDLYKIAKAKIKDDDDINEAIQETIIKAYSSIKKLKDEKYFKTWIIRILINECNNIYKKKKVNKIEEYNENVIKEADSDMINTKINNLDFFILIDKLNEDEKIVVVLFYLEEYSTKQLDMKIDNTNKTEFTAQERVLDDNNKIIMNNVGNTKFATYITIQKITENKAIFSRSLDGVAGLNTISLQDLDKNLENIEFALLYGSRSKIIAEEFIIQIPEQDNQTAKIDNIEIVDIDSVE